MYELNSLFILSLKSGYLFNNSSIILSSLLFSSMVIFSGRISFNLSTNLFCLFPINSFNLFVLGSDPYGNRLKGISKVKISSKEQSSVASFLKEKEEVVDASVHLKGKIIYIHIKMKEGVNLNRAKEIANESLGKFEDDEKSFYDFGYFLSEDKEGGYVVTGTKNSNSDVIVWIKS